MPGTGHCQCSSIWLLVCADAGGAGVLAVGGADRRRAPQVVRIGTAAIEGVQDGAAASRRLQSRRRSALTQHAVRANRRQSSGRTLLRLWLRASVLHTARWLSCGLAVRVTTVITVVTVITVTLGC